MGTIINGKGIYVNEHSSIRKNFQVPEGMPLSVFLDRYSRRKDDGTLQSYEERIRDVVDGNQSLDPRHGCSGYNAFAGDDYQKMMDLALRGVMPFSGRHLQHGDMSQRERTMEVFTNCSTAAFSFMTYLLLLNGSGVGRDYSADSCRVNWDFMPEFRLVLSGGDDDSGDPARGAHLDFREAMSEFQGVFESLRDARHKYDGNSERVRWFQVKDSREGWAEVIAILETAAFHKNNKDSLFIFDFSGCRPKGAPIKGMQNRPAQGPVPFMRALAKISTIKGAGMQPWKQALFVDHYSAACVVMGNVRRAARMATKHWRDRDVIEFIDIKRGGFLWSANNSITVDAEFWSQARDPRPSHARRVFEAAVASAYFDQTGEPGFINVDKINADASDWDQVTSRNYIQSNGLLDLHPKTLDMIDYTLLQIKKKPYPFITNPCGEISLAAYGGYCVIGDVCLANAHDKEDAVEAVRLMAPFLVRVNRMKAMYQAEVARTNRIGIGITGIHEFAYKFYDCTFADLLSAYDWTFNGGSQPDLKVVNFWRFLAGLRSLAEASARQYASDLGMRPPHTVTTIKPSGTISKVMNCTEGAHLPAVLHYVRWVIFAKGSAEVDDFRTRGYPIKDVSHQYTNCVVVGFPTKQPITDVVPTEDIITAESATPEQHFHWVRLLEHYWLGGDRQNNQVSYTLKYDPEAVSYEDFMKIILEFQPLVKCCSVMPVVDTSAYAYTPEEPIDRVVYEAMAAKINMAAREAYDENALACSGGVCPIEQVINAS